MRVQTIGTAALPTRWALFELLGFVSKCTEQPPGERSSTASDQLYSVVGLAQRGRAVLPCSDGCAQRIFIRGPSPCHNKDSAWTRRTERGLVLA